MATWPSGSKASTTNLDSGADKPSLARADLKQNVDNVNAVIDMFNIASPSDNQILKYSTANSRFDLATPSAEFTTSDARTAISVTDSGGDGSLAYNSSTGVITYTGPSAADVRAHFSGGTGITITDGVVATTVTDTNTTYGISSETATGGVNLRLTGSDASTDNVKLAEGSNITITRTDADTITIAGSAGGIANVVEDTTPQLGGSLDVNGQSIVSVSNGNITLAPNGSGKVVLSGIQYPTINGTNGQVLTTNGSGVASWAAPAAGGPTMATFYTDQYSSGYQSWIHELVNTAGVTRSTNNLGVIVGTGTWFFVIRWGDVINTSTTATNYNIRNHTDQQDISQNSLASNSTLVNLFSHVNSFVVSSGTKEIRLTQSANANILSRVYFDIYKIA